MFAYSYVKVNRNMDTEQKPLTSAFSEMRAKILRFAARFFPSEEDAEDAGGFLPTVVPASRHLFRSGGGGICKNHGAEHWHR